VFVVGGLVGQEFVDKQHGACYAASLGVANKPGFSRERLIPEVAQCRLPKTVATDSPKVSSAFASIATT
jgi:hypothetical protein